MNRHGLGKKKKYEVVIPLIFGKWDFLKSMTGEFVYNISLLGKGLLFDNPNLIRIEGNEFRELISYFGIKATSLTQSFDEEKIGELISLWLRFKMMVHTDGLTDMVVQGVKMVLP